MRRRALLMSGKKFPLIFTIDTTKAGVTDSYSFQIPTIGGGYNYNVEWGDGNKTPGNTGSVSYTYATPGIYQIKIYGTFPRFYFNLGGDRLKLISIDSWGEDIGWSTTQTGAFYGCTNLISIALDPNGWYNNIIVGQSMFYQTGLTQLPENMTLSSISNNTYMFRMTPLTSLPEVMTLDHLTSAFHMFSICALTHLPSGMTLPNLTWADSMFFQNALTALPVGMTLPKIKSGVHMFNGNNITELPSGMELPLLTNGSYMFSNNGLTELPSGMELPLLTTGTQMFSNNGLTELPSGMELPLLTNGSYMFYNNGLTELPSGMELPLLTNGSYMFYNNGLTELPSGMELNNLLIGGGASLGMGMFEANLITDIGGLKLEKLTDGRKMFFNGNKIDTVQYSDLLIHMESNNANNNVSFHAGTSNYNSSASTARANLIGRGWTIADGGLI